VSLGEGAEGEMIRTGRDAIGDDPQANLLSAEEITQLEQAIAKLEVNERLAIRLRFQEELSFDHIGQVIGISSKFRVRKLINGAVNKIRRALSD